MDVVTSMVVGSNLSRTVTGNAALFGTLAATAIVLGLHWLLARAAAVSRAASVLVEGAPVVLAVRGSLLPGAKERQSVSDADLDEALHQAGLESVEQIGLIVLEPSGRITLLRNATG